MIMNNQYIKYLPYASPRQKEIVHALAEHQTAKAAAKVLGCSESNIRNIMLMLKQKAERQGFSEEHGITDQSIYATSTLVKGEPGDDFALRWTKAKSSKEQKVDRILAILDSYEYKKAPGVIKENSLCNTKLATLYTLTDYHLGMYAWAQESGDDWDTNIAQRVMMNAITDMTDRSPNSELGILNIQGDFLHWDG